MSSLLGSCKQKQRGLRGLLCHWPSITEWEMYIAVRGCRLRNDLYCVEWDVKLYYTIPYQGPGNKSRGISDDVTASVYLVMMLSYLITPPKPLSCTRGPAEIVSGTGFVVIGLLRPHPMPYEITYIYNTILNFIWVSFCTA